MIKQLSEGRMVLSRKEGEHTHTQKREREREMEDRWKE